MAQIALSRSKITTKTHNWPAAAPQTASLRRHAGAVPHSAPPS